MLATSPSRLIVLASGSQEAACEFQVGKGQIQAGNYR